MGGRVGGLEGGQGLELMKAMVGWLGKGAECVWKLKLRRQISLLPLHWLQGYWHGRHALASSSWYFPWSGRQDSWQVVALR